MDTTGARLTGTVRRAVLLLSATLPGLALAVAACGGPAGAPARAVRPSAPSAAEAMGDVCADAPLVVDLPAERRAEIESVLRRGVLLVRWDCRTLTLLPRCHPVIAASEQLAFGGYQYEAVQTKEDVVRMNDADAIRARLPTLGASFAASLEADLARGSTLDLALVVVGRYANAGAGLSRSEVEPSCREATHYAKAVTVGAFAMGVGTRAQTRAVADVFGAGASAESASARAHESRDGDLSSCRRASPTDRTPPVGCQAPLRLDLAKIDPRHPYRAKCEDEGKACAAWASLTMVDPSLTGDRPLVAKKLVEHCLGGDVAACASAHAFALQYPEVGIDDARVVKRGCELRDPHCCVDHGYALQKSGASSEDTAAAFETACNADPGDCFVLADWIDAGAAVVPPAERAQKLADLRGRGCLSLSTDCDKYAVLYRQGLRARTVDVGRAKKSVDDCFAPAATRQAYCSTTTAAVLAFGLGVPRDPARARRAWAQRAVTTTAAKPAPYPPSWP
jgi:uncharacterized protein